MSDHDRAVMAGIAPNTAVVPTEVDVAHFRRGGVEAPHPRRVIFLGSVDWPANIDGVEPFCEQIWPRVLATVPDATFQVVGRIPPQRIRRLASDSVEIVGGVTSVLPDLHDASVFVVPLRIGGGTRLKIYEAMAAALPIVSTRVGAEGLEVTNGQDILLEDDPSRFAEEVIGLLCRSAEPDRGRRRGNRSPARTAPGHGTSVGVFDPLDLLFQAFGDRIGDAMGEVGEDVLEMPAQRLSGEGL